MYKLAVVEAYKKYEGRTDWEGWKDFCHYPVEGRAAAFYINQCLAQKDKLDLDSFQEMFEILKIVSM